jgi:AcrR family transcriptional regulator
MTGPPKKDALLSSGRALLLRHGLRKVRVEEVCADARVSKRTFYKYFRDKDDLAIAVLATLFDEGRVGIEAILALEVSLEEKARQIIAAKTRLASHTSAVFYREALDGTTEPGRFALREQRKWDEQVRRFYRDAQGRGEIRPDIDVDVLMVVLVRVRELLKDAELVRLVPDLPRLVEMLMKLFFYGVVPRSAPRRERRKKP